MTLAVSQLIGFGSVAAGGAPSKGSIISVASYIGQYTFNGNLAASFNGATDTAAASCSARASNTNGYIGANLSAANKKVWEVAIHGSNNSGYVDGADPSVTAYLYGKTGGAPSNGTDGTLLGSITFTDTSNESAARTISSSDVSTAWAYVWIYFTHASTNHTMYSAEISIYESV